VLFKEPHVWSFRLNRGLTLNIDIKKTFLNILQIFFIKDNLLETDIITVSSKTLPLIFNAIVYLEVKFEIID